jgi:hypothetical protein
VGSTTLLRLDFVFLPILRKGDGRLTETTGKRTRTCRNKRSARGMCGVLLLERSQERLDRPLVTSQCLRRDQTVLLIEPEVLVGGLDLRTRCGFWLR